MFYSIRGRLLRAEPGFAVIEAGGVGYKLAITFQTLSKLPAQNSEVMLYTHLNVREDAIDLFGFYDESELNCFKMLTSVNGVGPKAALSILSDASPEKFALYVATGDVKSITRAQGIGPKLAQRIVLELKDKVTSQDVGKGITQTAIPNEVGGGNAGEAISALLVLGYSQAQAAQAVAQLNQNSTVEELIKEALKILAKG